MKNGPAMAFGIFSVIYNHLGQSKKAEEMFRRSYRPNVHPPFNAFAETPSSHNPYFATGAGAMLQAVINGFGGLSITDHGIAQHHSVLPASWKKLTITGVGKDKKTYTVVNSNK
jgi:trehalose/maltose hydrolase-like predicted phosphorylase